MLQTKGIVAKIAGPPRTRQKIQSRRDHLLTRIQPTRPQALVLTLIYPHNAGAPGGICAIFHIHEKITRARVNPIAIVPGEKLVFFTE